MFRVIRSYSVFRCLIAGLLHVNELFDIDLQNFTQKYTNETQSRHDFEGFINS